MKIQPKDLLGVRSAVASRARRRSFEARALRPPDAAVARYQVGILRVTKAWQGHVTKSIADQLPKVEAAGGSTRVSRADGQLPGSLERKFRALAQDVDGFLDEQGIRALIANNADAIEGYSLDELTRSIGIDMTASGVGLGALVNVFRESNVLLIRSLMVDQLVDLNTLLSDNIGQRVETLSAHIEDRYGVTRSRATLIARDQTLKLNAGMNQQRQQSVGVSEYIWRATGDERVRGRPDGKWPVRNGSGDHWGLNNNQYKWVEPPIVEENTGRRCNPGEDFQCRCTATPVLDGIF